MRSLPSQRRPEPSSSAATAFAVALTRRLLAALLVVVVAFVASPATALAQDDIVQDDRAQHEVAQDAPGEEPESQFATVDIEVLTTIPAVQRSTVDALVSVRTDRAVTGTLVVSDNPQGAPSTTWEYEIDQAAGTSVEVPVVVTSTWDGINVDVSLNSGGETIASNSSRQFPDGGSEVSLIGTLGIADPPRFVDGPADEPLSPFSIDRAPGSISRLSTLVASPDAFTNMLAGPTGAAAEAWLRGGGQLVIAGSTRSLDDRFHQFPTASPDRFLVGAGSVLYDTEWADGLTLGGYIGTDSLQINLEEQGFGYGAGGELGLLADLSLPRASVVTGVLIGYAVIAGPLMFLVLGRSSRQRLMWLILPGIAALVAAAVLVVGLLDAQGRGDAHITIVEVNDQGSRATSNLLLSARGGGSREIITPADWRFLGQNTSANERSVRVRPDASGLRVAMELPPGGSGNVRVTGPAAQYDGTIRIENIRRNGDGGLTADVVNNSGSDLEGAVGFLGNERITIGDIPAGTISAFSIDTVANDRLMQELLIWPRVRQEWTNAGPIAVPQDRNADDAIEAGAWSAWRIEQGTTATPEHVIGVAAWTDGLDSPIGGIEEGNTALFVRTEVPSDLLGDGWTSTTYRPSFTGGPPLFFDNFFGWPQDYRVSLGPDTNVDELQVTVGRQAAAVGVSIDGVLHWADLPEDQPGNATLTLQLPDGIDSDVGELVVQVLIPEWEWNAPRTVFFEPLDENAETVEWRAGEPLIRFDNGFGPGFEPGFEPFPEFPGAAQGVEIVEGIAIEDIAIGEPQVFESFLGRGQGASYLVLVPDGASLTATMRSERDDSYLELWINGSQITSNDDFEGLDSQVTHTAFGDEFVEVVAMGLGGQDIEYQLTIEVTE